MRAVQRMQRAIENHFPRSRFMRLANTGAGAGATIRTFLEMVIGVFFGVIMIPIIEEVIRTTNTTAWNFTGSAGAITIFRMIPFIFIAGVIVWFVGKIFKKW